MTNLAFRYNDTAIRVAYCVTKWASFNLRAQEVLSQQELEKYNSFKIESGRNEYLLGRYSAKQAYFKVINQKVDYRTINIRNGVFEQPFFTNDASLGISISHSRNVGGAIVFDKAFPMGIDLEVVDEETVRTIQPFISNDEIAHIKGKRECILVAVWCMKEALSKVIRTGLTIPFELLKIACAKGNDNFFECYFENFPQYKGIAEIGGSHAAAITYPRQLTTSSQAAIL